MAVADLLDAIQGQMIQIFLDQDPRMETWRSQTTIDDGSRHRRGDDGLAGAAGILRTNMAMDKETGRLNVKLFADVFTDLDQIVATFATGAGFRFVPMFNARQFRWQWIAAGAFMLTWRDGRFLLLFRKRSIKAPLAAAIEERSI